LYDLELHTFCQILVFFQSHLHVGSVEMIDSMHVLCMVEHSVTINTAFESEIKP